LQPNSKIQESRKYHPDVTSCEWGSEPKIFQPSLVLSF
jgi:hypothetical protein